MAKPHHHQQPRPTPAPTPVQARLPEAEAPVVTSLALGRVSSGRHAVALLKTQGRKVVSCALLAPPSDAQTAEDTWSEHAYSVLYHDRTPATVQGPPLVDGHALALVRNEKGRTSAVLLEVEEGRLAVLGAEDSAHRVLFTGGKLDAWQELEHHAAHNLLRESLVQRRRKAGG